MTTTIVAFVAILALAAPAAAQQMDHSKMPGMSMPGMKMPAKKKPAAKPAARKPAARKPASGPAARKASVKPAARRATPVARPAARNQARPAAKPRSRPESRGSSAATRRPSAAASAPVADPHAGHDMSSMPETAAPGVEGAEQTMDHSNMPGMNMPTTGGAQAMDHADMPGMSGTTAMGATRPGHTATGTALPAGDAPAPAAPTDSYADRIYSPAAMAAAREDLRSEHGGGKFSMVLFNLAEYQVRQGRDGFRLDGSAWYGGDINRIVLKTEAEGSFRGQGVESAEVQVLGARAVGPYTDIQLGVRYDFEPDPSRVYATVGFETLAPGFLDVEGALFLSNKGDLLGRLEGYYDQRITQRLILQPEGEINFALQDVRENGIGSGISDLELGLRLRYEIKREFAPYVGVSYERKIGDTARFARAEGEGAGSTSLVLGVRTWF